MNVFFRFLVVLSVYLSAVFLMLQIPLLWAQFVVGFLLGLLVILIDRALHAFYLFPEDIFSREVIKLGNQRKYFQVVIQLMSVKVAQKKLFTRSILFFITYMALSLFIVTSSGSMVGIGVIGGIGLFLCFEFITYMNDVDAFHIHFLWQLKKRLTKNEVRNMVCLFCLYFLALTAWSLL